MPSISQGVPKPATGSHLPCALTIQRVVSSISRSPTGRCCRHPTCSPVRITHLRVQRRTSCLQGGGVVLSASRQHGTYACSPSYACLLLSCLVRLTFCFFLKKNVHDRTWRFSSHPPLISRHVVDVARIHKTQQHLGSYHVHLAAPVMDFSVTDPEIATNTSCTPLCMHASEKGQR